MTKILGFKATSQEMTPNISGCNIQYNLSDTFKLNGIPLYGTRGFHFSTDIFRPFEYYQQVRKMRLFVVEASGQFDQDYLGGRLCYSDFCCSEIRFLYEIHWTCKFLHEQVCNNNSLQMALSNSGYNHPAIFNHPNKNIRANLASFGFDLDTYYEDESSLVRYQVAKQGYALDKLACDSDHNVKAMALQMLNCSKTQNNCVK